MEREEEILDLLREIRDLQRSHLDEYRRRAAESISIQQVAVERQVKSVRVQLVGVSFAALAIAAGVWLLTAY